LSGIVKEKLHVTNERYILMDKHLLLDLSQQITQISKKASESIMDIYLKGKFSQYKKGDGSFLTEADMSSHRLILEGLKKIGLDIPVLSEEGETISKRTVEMFWLVDPLDGTREFIGKNDEFTVNIALIEKGKPVLGVVNAPAKDELFLGVLGQGSYRIKKGVSEVITTKDLNKDMLRITLSKSHQSDRDLQFIEKAKKRFKNIEVIAAGSSLKLCRVAEGNADIYCRLGPTFQWDIASGQAVLESAGGVLKSLIGERFRYTFESNKRNPEFYSVGDSNYDWKELLP